MLKPLWVSPAMTELGDDMHTMAMFQSYQWQIPRDPITLSVDDWGVQSPPQHSI